MEPEISQKCEKCRRNLDHGDTHFCAHKKRLLSYCGKCFQKACFYCKEQKQLQILKVENQSSQKFERILYENCALCSRVCKCDYMNLGGTIFCLKCVEENSIRYQQYKQKTQFSEKMVLGSVKNKENIKEKSQIQPFRPIRAQNTIKITQSKFKRQQDHRMKLQKQLDQFENVYLCSICCEKNKNCINTVCSHLACCYECGIKEKKCPLCRAEMSPVKIYI